MFAVSIQTFFTLDLLSLTHLLVNWEMAVVFFFFFLLQNGGYCYIFWSRQLYSFCVLVRLCSKSFTFGFNNTCTENFQMYKLDLENAEEPAIKLPTFVVSQRQQVNSRKTSTSVSLTMLKPLTMWVTTNCWKFLKRWECQTTLLVSEKHACRSRSNS